MDPRFEAALTGSLPQAFINKKGEPILIAALDEKRHERLVEMYLAYQPRNSFQGLPPIKDEVCRQWVQSMIDSGINLVALSFGEGVVGHAALFPIDNNVCEFLVVVSPPLQNTGIGTELTRCAIQLACEIGFETIRLSVEARNVRARRVYRKCGFEYVSRTVSGELDMALDLRRQRDVLNVPVGAIMTTNVTAISEEESCRSALRVFLETGVAALPVINSERRLMGILSKSDLMLPSALNKSVGDVFTRETITAQETWPLRRIIRTLQSKRVRCLPVVDSQMRLVGVIGRRDILSYYQKHLLEKTNGILPD